MRMALKFLRYKAHKRRWKSFSVSWSSRFTKETNIKRRKILMQKFPLWEQFFFCHKAKPIITLLSEEPRGVWWHHWLVDVSFEFWIKKLLNLNLQYQGLYCGKLFKWEMTHYRLSRFVFYLTSFCVHFVLFFFCFKPSHYVFNRSTSNLALFFFILYSRKTSPQ